MSDLGLGERDLDWTRVLDLAAITPGPSLGRKADGFDYVVVAGNLAARAGNGRPAAGGDSLAEALSYVRPLLRTDHGWDRRILFVPGPWDPQPWPGLAGKEFPEVRVLEDLTLIGASYWQSEPAQLAAQLRLLDQQIRRVAQVLASQKLEYARSTPTLLVTSGPLVLDEREQGEVAPSLLARLRQLGVTLHLCGKSSATCRGPDPFGCRHVAISTGPATAAAGETPLQMNSLTLTVRGDRPRHYQNYSNWHSVAIRALSWSSDEQRWRGVSYIRNEFDRFFRAQVSQAPRIPVHRSVFSRLTQEIDNGKRSFCLSGMPGSGKRVLWEDLKACDRPLRNIDEVLLLELDYASLERQLDGVRLRVEALNRANSDAKLLLAVFDSSLRQEGRNPDSVTEPRTRLLQAFGRFLSQADNICILYLVKRIENDPLSSYGIDIDWTYVRLLPLAEREEIRGLVERYSRVVPLDVERLRRWSGYFVGFAEVLMQGAAANFRQQIRSHGQRDVSIELAASLIRGALAGGEILDRSSEFFSSFGPRNRRVLNVVAERLRRQADARDRGASDDEQLIRIGDLEEQLGRRNRIRIQRLLNRLVDYGAIVDDQGQYRLGPCAPFLLADRLLAQGLPSSHRAFFAYHRPHLELASQLKMRVTDLAPNASLGLDSILLPEDADGGSFLMQMDRAASGSEILVVVYDDRFADSRALQSELARWDEAHPRDSDGLLIPVAVGDVREHPPLLNLYTPIRMVEGLGAHSVAGEIIRRIQRYSDERQSDRGVE